jgi:mannose-6-phosphate isomerase-like protein (cupin superfamily)
MAELIEKPTTVAAAGNVPKVIEEFVGRVNTGTGSVSIAHMTSPGGWSEPGQRPEFDEYTIVLAGTLVVEDAAGTTEVPAGQAIHSRAGDWVRYSSPDAAGADYIAVCLPAFSPESVHRDES